MWLHVTVHFVIVIESVSYCNRHAEVHHFQKLQEELVRKTEEVRVLEDHIADIYLELTPCTQRFCRAKVVERVKSQQGEAIHLISPWTFECRYSA